jgi:carbamoyl-phosphate synthase large subunit
MSFNILFSSAGRRVELIRCFQKAAEELNIVASFFAADVTPDWSPACFIVNKSIAVPYCHHPDFISKIFQYCIDEKIQIIIPTIDTELLLYAQNIELFRSIGVTIVIPSIDFVTIARDKRKTIQYFSVLGLKCPKTWYSLEESQNFIYPLIAKPVNGSCSVGLQFINTPKELEQLATERFDYLFQEYINGSEYTVNCYYENGQLRAAIPHKRVKTRSGEVLFGETRRIPVLTDVAKKLATGTILLDGVICFQAFCKDEFNGDDYKLIEINARFGGGYPLCDMSGGHFAKWILQQKIIGRSEATDEYWDSGVRMLRYDTAVFYKTEEKK